MILFPEFLQSRVEVPMLGIVTGGAMAFMALLILSLIVLCLMQKNKSKPFGKTADMDVPHGAEQGLVGVYNRSYLVTDQPVEIVMTKKRSVLPSARVRVTLMKNVNCISF